MGQKSSTLDDLIESSNILLTEQVPISDNDFWEEVNISSVVCCNCDCDVDFHSFPQFWVLPSDHEEIHKFMDAEYLNDLILTYPSNMAALVTQVR